ncbi:pilus assembly protein [Altererythrobacter salegens]|uniref:Pilus assembly protein n=1 Tax=Croceibacterium salegens TaxID=1737568 RepID=A0A6I4SZD5_9SPHN|nr:TadE/TadG family type IV pilus assembly protein [Croceibacterium salegens]MXO59632.1 pilus assembly protein [Croceibacterium salegens]
MIALRRLFRLDDDNRGTMAIETALIAPLLATMSLGVFEVSNLVSREQQLQSAASEAGGIILAAAGGSGITSSELETIIETSLNLNSNQLTIIDKYRCGTSSTLSSTVPTCTGQQIYSYVEMTLTDTYTPVWTRFGVGQPVNFNVVRTVQVS